MKELKLYNTAHPLADTGKPIFIPFGEWRYDATRRQRLDRAHGERIANELNARVARGDPGIPVYAGHPDVPQLAARYPDKGALGWVTKIELANESGKEGLALTVEWDRDPGKGFRWFSPYWFANEVERDGVTYIVSEISSIGLVNNPNIPEFRLANETPTPSPTHPPASPKRLAPTIIALAAKYDRLANEANFDESKHPRANDGKFTDGGGGGDVVDTQPQAKEKLRSMIKSEAVSIDAGGKPSKDDVVFEYRHKMYYVGKDSEHMVDDFVKRGLVKRVRGYQNVVSKDDGKGLSRRAFIAKEPSAMRQLMAEFAARYYEVHKAK